MNTENRRKAQTKRRRALIGFIEERRIRYLLIGGQCTHTFDDALFRIIPVDGLQHIWHRFILCIVKKICNA